MAEHNTGIEWTHLPGFRGETWNPITGCRRVSEGCRNCYAERLAGTRLKDTAKYRGTTDAQGRWNGVFRFHEDALLQPLRWRKPRAVFVNSMSDLFGEGVEDGWLDRIFAVMALCPQHVFLILTKRPERMRSFVQGTNLGAEAGASAGALEFSHRLSINEWANKMTEPPDHDFALSQPWPLPNVWLGVSVEDQGTADARVPLLLDTPAVVRFVSYEPALGPVDFSPWLGRSRNYHMSVSVEGALRNKSFEGLQDANGCPLSKAEAKALLLRLQADGVRLLPLSECDGFDSDKGCPGHLNPSLDWPICGGESGRDARPMHPDWPRKVRDDCVAAGVPFFFKQWGEWLPGSHCDDVSGDTLLHTPFHLFNPDDVDQFCGSFRVGKKAAGRLLDGREWSEFPVGVGVSG